MEGTLMHLHARRPTSFHPPLCHRSLQLRGAPDPVGQLVLRGECLFALSHGKSQFRSIAQLRGGFLSHHSARDRDHCAKFNFLILTRPGGFRLPSDTMTSEGVMKVYCQ